MYHLSDNGIDDAILGSSNFTLRGLGLGSATKSVSTLRRIVIRNRRDLKAWFEEIWNNLELVEDKPEVLRYLQQLYVNHAPRIYLLQDPLSRVREVYMLSMREACFSRTRIVETEIS